jgi:hypothetical protein
MNIQHLAIELLVGAVGYNIRKYLGEELTKYVFHPLVNRLRKYLFSPVWRWLVARLIRTEKDAAIWLHHKNKHRERSPLRCPEGKCYLVR